MLRNTAVNVTERKIRQDTQKAYEYDVFHGYPSRSWRRDDGYLAGDRYDAGFKTNIRRQPRYNYTIPRHIPTYARSSISSCIKYSELDRVKMVYLPEKDWSAESPYHIREPRYREKSYSNHKLYHIGEMERPLRRNVRYNVENRSRRRSSICLDENQMDRIIDATKYIIDSYCPKMEWDTSKYKSPGRKVTRKLSPIRTRDCNTQSNVQQPKKNCTTNFDNLNRTHTKPKSNNLSREPRKMSLDINKILSLLQKADAEEEEQYSSESLFEKVHNFECSSTNNVNHGKTDVITERVQIFSNMEKKRPDPVALFKNVSGVRSKLEALVDLLKQYEDENTRTSSPTNDSAKKHIESKYEYPPTQEARSLLNEKDVKLSNDDATENIGRKDIVLQTERPKTSNKSVSGMIIKKYSSEDRKKLKTRFSWKGKEKTEFKKHKEREKDTIKESERKKISYFKRISKDMTLAEKTMASKQNLNNSHEVKTGLMITIGGKILRKKLAKSENRQEKMSQTWLKKYSDSKKDTKDNNIHHRWNNRAYYTKSSSTVMELIHNVYNQMGINVKSKTDDVSRNPNILKSSRRNHHKSSRKTRNRQRLEAYMMPQMVTHGPVYMPDKILNANTNHVTKSVEKLMSNKKLPFGQNLHLQNEYIMNSKILTMTNDPDSIFFRIYMAKDYFDTVPISKQEPRNSTSDERVYKIVEYEATKSDVFTNSFSENFNEETSTTAHYKKNDDVHRDAIVQVSYDNSGFLKNCGVEPTIVSKQDPENEASKPEYQIQGLVDEEASSKTSTALAKPALQDSRSLPVFIDFPLPAHEILGIIKDGHQDVEKNNAANAYNQDVSIQSSKLSSPTHDHDQEMVCPQESADITLSLTVPDKNTKTANKNRVLLENITNVYKRKKFSISRKSKRCSRVKPIVIIRWNNYIEPFSKRQFKIDKCNSCRFDTEKKSKAENQPLLKIKSTQYSYQIPYPFVHEMPYQQAFPIPQHLQLPQYLPQPLCVPQLSCQTQYPKHHVSKNTKIYQQPYEPQLLSYSTCPLRPKFISEVPQSTFDQQDGPKTQYPLKFETSFEPEYTPQTLYAPIAEPTFEPKYAPQVKYLPRVKLKPGPKLSTRPSFLLGSQYEVRTPEVQYSPGVQCVPEAEAGEIYIPLMHNPSQFPFNGKPEKLKAYEKLESKNLNIKPCKLLLSAPKKTLEILPIAKRKKLNAIEQSQSKILFESKQLVGITQAGTKYHPVIFEGDRPDAKLKLKKSEHVIKLSSVDSPVLEFQPLHYSSGHQVQCLQSPRPQCQLKSYTQYSQPVEPRQLSQSQTSDCLINAKHETSDQMLMHEQSQKPKTLTQSSQDRQGTKLRLTQSNKVNQEDPGITEIYYRRCKDGMRFNINPFKNIAFIETRSKKKRVTKELNNNQNNYGSSKIIRNKNTACIRQTTKLGRNNFSSNKSYINSDSSTSEVQLKLQLTRGGQVINIYINDDGDPRKINNLKSTYLQCSHENRVNNKAREQIVQPSIQILNDCKKIDVGIVNSREFKISKNTIDHVISDGFSENVFDEFNRAAKRLSDSVLYVSNTSNQNYYNSFHKISRQCCSKATSPLNEEARDNNVDPDCVVKSKIQRTNSQLKNIDSQVDKSSSMENCNAIVGYVNNLLGPVAKIKHSNLKWVVETKSMLEAINTMNASVGADMTLTNNDRTYYLIEPNKSQYRQIMDKIKKGQNNKKIKTFKEQNHITKKENPVVKSKISRFSSLCNNLARKLNIYTISKRQHEKLDVKTSCNIIVDRKHVTCSVSNLEIQDVHRHNPVNNTGPAASLANNKKSVDDSNTVVGKHDMNDIGQVCEIPKCKSSKRDNLFTNVKKTGKTNCNISTDKDYVTCSVSSLEIRDIQRHSPVTSTVPAASLENNKNAVDDSNTVVIKHNTNDIGPASDIPQCKYSKREKILLIVKQPFSQCMKNMKKNSNKKNGKNKAKTYKKQEAIILANIAPSRYHEKTYLLEQKDSYEIPVLINEHSVRINNNSMDVIFNESDQANILQSDTVKKAVLQIYTDNSITHKDYLVANVPKYLFL